VGVRLKEGERRREVGREQLGGIGGAAENLSV